MAGQLFVVGTPIGNLSDITLRALEVLRQTPHLAVEDTRRTRVLLAHFAISGKSLHRLDAHAGPERIERLLSLLAEGQDVALVTDAGTPSVSDPGSALVAAARRAGARVVAIPGVSAVTTAVAVSGVVEGAFCFFGFLPRQGAKRRAALARIAQTPSAVVLFEAPQRAQETLGALAALMGSRPAVVCRELTKLHEEVVAGTLSELAQREDWRGEITLVLAPDSGADDQEASVDPADLEQAIRARLLDGVTPHTLVREFAAQSAQPRRDLYALIQRLNQELRAPDKSKDG